MNRLWLAIFLISICCVTEAQDSQNDAPPDGAMTLESLDEIFGMMGSNLKRESGLWTFNYNDVQVTCLVSIEHDRMRIIAPVKLVSRLSEEHREKMLEANYHSALDARYSTNNGVVYSTFIHPLSPLTEGQIISAVDQVASLVLTFGSSYSSGTLRFRPPGEEGGDEGPADDGVEITT